MIKAKVKLSFQKRSFDFFYAWPYDYESLKFYFKEGNFACDCNRAREIRFKCDPNFKDMECGDLIKLLSLRECSVKEEEI